MVNIYFYKYSTPYHLVFFPDAELKSGQVPFYHLMPTYKKHPKGANFIYVPTGGYVQNFKGAKWDK
ncbi:MAG: hypothetical protein PHT88_05250 [Candidatus Moranbacteria bacterium]|nr:hypothetical protein [Candidatus Moranbacteria bacterium]